MTDMRLTMSWGGGERDMQNRGDWRRLEEGVECAPQLIGYEVGRCPIEWLRLK